MSRPLTVRLFRHKRMNQQHPTYGLGKVRLYLFPPSPRRKGWKTGDRCALSALTVTC